MSENPPDQQATNVDDVDVVSSGVIVTAERSSVAVPDEEDEGLPGLPTKVLAILEQQQSLSFKGPLPPPEWAERYEKILPGFLDRQVRLQERRADLADREITLTERIVLSEADIKSRGQLFAAGIAIGFLLVAAFIGATNPWAGATIAMVDVSALTAAFVIGRHLRSKQRKALPEANENDSENSEEDEDG